VPMSDDPVRTIAVTADGDLAFQDYFVRLACEPVITGIRFDGVEQSNPSPAFAQALARADAIVFCPSNPLVSVGPVLAVPGIYEKIESFTGARIAVSPIVGGQALKGPAAKMMAELGEEVNCSGVAHRYMGICDALVVDTMDAAEAAGVESHGLRAVVTNTIMRTEADKEQLAREVLELV